MRAERTACRCGQGLAEDRRQIRKVFFKILQLPKALFLYGPKSCCRCGRCFVEATDEVQPAEFEAFRQKILVAEPLRILPPKSLCRKASKSAATVPEARVPATQQGSTKCLAYLTSSRTFVSWLAWPPRQSPRCTQQSPFRKPHWLSLAASTLQSPIYSSFWCAGFSQITPEYEP